MLRQFKLFMDCLERIHFGKLYHQALVAVSLATLLSSDAMTGFMHLPETSKKPWSQHCCIFYLCKKSKL